MISITFHGGTNGVKIQCRIDGKNAPDKNVAYDDKYMDINEAQHMLNSLQEAIEHTQKDNPVLKCPYCSGNFHAEKIGEYNDLAEHIKERH